MTPPWFILGAILASGVTGAIAALVHPVVAILWLPVLLGCLWAMTNPFLLLLGFVVVLFTRPAEFLPVLTPLQLGKVTSLASLGLLGAVMMTQRRIHIARTPHNVLMAVFTIIILISSQLGTDTGASMATFKDLFVKILILYVLIVHLVITRRRHFILQMVIALACSFIAVYGLWAQWTGTATIEGSRAALVGYLGDPNDMAMTLLMGAPFALQGASMAKGPKRVFYVILTLVLIGGVLSTQSRGGLLGLAGAGYFVMRDRIKNNVVLGVLIAGALAGALLLAGVNDRSSGGGGHGEIDESAQGRLDAWAAGGRMVMAKPAFGVGFSRFADNYERYVLNPVIWGKHETHNMYIKCAAETGLLGFGAFMALLLRSLWISWRVRASLPESSDLDSDIAARGQLPCLIAVGISAFFLSACWSWFVYILVAQATALERIHTSKEAST